MKGKGADHQAGTPNQQQPKSGSKPKPMPRDKKGKKGSNA